MEPAENALLSPWRLRWYPRALAGALGIALVLLVLTASGSTALTGRLGGDLPAFVGAARLVAEGHVALLYDWAAQAAAQAGLHGGDTGDFLAFAYPPFVAAAYLPLARLPWGAAYLVHAALMAAALWGAARLSAATRPAPFTDATGAFCAALLLLPLMRAVTGGQNTSLSVLLVAGTWWGLHHRREALAGVAAGLLLFKPQLAVPLLGLLLLGRHWRALAAAAGVGLALYLAGVAVAGWGWPGWWWEQISTFHAVDQAINAPNSVGILGFSEAVLGPGSAAALVVGGTLTLGAVAAVAWAWVRPVPLHLRVGLAAAAMVLVPPHSMSYDSGLVIVTLWAIAAHSGRAALPGLLALGAAALLGLAAQPLGLNPLFLVVVVAGGWAMVLAVRARSSAVPSRTAR